MNVVELPEQTVVDAVEILNAGVTKPATVIVMALLVAVVEVIHALLLVSIHVTISPVAKVVIVYVAEFVPTLLPFSFH